MKPTGRSNMESSLQATSHKPYHTERLEDISSFFDLANTISNAPAQIGFFGGRSFRIATGEYRSLDAIVKQFQKLQDAHVSEKGSVAALRGIVRLELAPTGQSVGLLTRLRRWFTKTFLFDRSAALQKLISLLPDSDEKKIIRKEHGLLKLVKKHFDSFGSVQDQRFQHTLFAHMLTALEGRQPATEDATANFLNESDIFCTAGKGRGSALSHFLSELAQTCDSQSSLFFKKIAQEIGKRTTQENRQERKERSSNPYTSPKDAMASLFAEYTSVHFKPNSVCNVDYDAHGAVTQTKALNQDFTQEDPVLFVSFTLSLQSIEPLRQLSKELQQLGSCLDATIVYKGILHALFKNSPHYTAIDRSLREDFAFLRHSLLNISADSTYRPQLARAFSLLHSWSDHPIFQAQAMLIEQTLEALLHPEKAEHTLSTTFSHPLFTESPGFLRSFSGIQFLIQTINYFHQHSEFHVDAHRLFQRLFCLWCNPQTVLSGPQGTMAEFANFYLSYSLSLSRELWGEAVLFRLYEECVSSNDTRVLLAHTLIDDNSEDLRKLYKSHPEAVHDLFIELFSWSKAVKAPLLEKKTSWMFQSIHDLAGVSSIEELVQKYFVGKITYLASQRSVPSQLFVDFFTKEVESQNTVIKWAEQVQGKYLQENRCRQLIEQSFFLGNTYSTVFPLFSQRAILLKQMLPQTLRANLIGSDILGQIASGCKEAQQSAFVKNLRDSLLQKTSPAVSTIQQFVKLGADQRILMCSIIQIMQLHGEHLGLPSLNAFGSFLRKAIGDDLFGYAVAEHLLCIAFSHPSENPLLKYLLSELHQPTSTPSPHLPLDDLSKEKVGKSLDELLFLAQNLPMPFLQGYRTRLQNTILSGIQLECTK